MRIPTEFGDWASTLIAGGWAFLGAYMRGSEWRTPNGLFSVPRFGVSVATALVLGEIIVAIGTARHWEPTIVGGAAGAAGYLGPAATMAFFKKRFFGDGNDAPSPADSK